jgi:hypothetical protein
VPGLLEQEKGLKNRVRVVTPPFTWEFGTTHFHWPTVACHPVFRGEIQQLGENAFEEREL